MRIRLFELEYEKIVISEIEAIGKIKEFNNKFSFEIFMKSGRVFTSGLYEEGNCIQMEKSLSDLMDAFI